MIFDSAVPYEVVHEGRAYRRACIVRDTPDRLDGDTVRAMLDLGHGATLTATLRVADLACPERFKGSPAERQSGEQSWRRARFALPHGCTVLVHTEKTARGLDRETFGRLVARILILAPDADGRRVVPIDFAAWMIADGQGTRWADRPDMAPAGSTGYLPSSTARPDRPSHGTTA